MPEIKTTINNTLVRILNKENSSTGLGDFSTTIFDISMEIPSKKPINIVLPSVSGILQLVIFLKEMDSAYERDNCTSTFIVALLPRTGNEINLDAYQYMNKDMYTWVYPQRNYSAITMELFSKNKVWNFGLCIKLDETWNYLNYNQKA